MQRKKLIQFYYYINQRLDEQTKWISKKNSKLIKQYKIQKEFNLKHLDIFGKL